MRVHRCSTRIALLTVLAVMGPGAGVALAQAKVTPAKAMLTKFAGSDDTDALLREPVVQTELQKLVGSQLSHLKSNMDVRGSVDVISGALAVSGNAPHGGTEEEAIVCVAPPGTVVEAAIYSKGTVDVFARAEQYEYLMICTKDWVTQVNSKHADRFAQPKNVRLVRPR